VPKDSYVPFDSLGKFNLLFQSASRLEEEVGKEREENTLKSIFANTSSVISI
jgi:hypothetical protein